MTDISDLPEQEQSNVDRRYLELCGALVDATKLDRLPPVQPLISGVLDRDSLAWIHGKPGHGKSFVALDIACHVGTGRPWRGYETAAGPVLYIVAEGAHGMHDRHQAWEIANQQQLAEGAVIFLPVAVQLLRNLDVNALIQLASEIRPALVVIDTQARVTVGGDENSAKDMGVLVDHLERLRAATGACVLLVHHEARAGDTLRGSTALEGAATTLIRAHKDGNLITLDNSKQKDAPEFDRVYGRLIGVDLPTGRTSAAWSHLGVGLADLTAESETKLVDAIRDSFGTTGAPATTLLDVTGMAKSTFYRALHSLVSKGIVRNDGTSNRTRYVLNDTEPMT